MTSAPVMAIVRRNDKRLDARIRFEMDIPSALATPIITAAAAVAAVVLGNKLSYARAYKEKLWDLKRPAYGTILSELASIEQICDVADEYISEDFDRYFHGVDQKDNAKIAKHFEIINKRIADDYLIMSEEFIALYDEFSKESSSNPYDFNPPEDHETFVGAVRKFRPLLIALARKEMKIKKKWSFFPI